MCMARFDLNAMQHKPKKAALHVALQATVSIGLKEQAKSDQKIIKGKGNNVEKAKYYIYSLLVSTALLNQFKNSFEQTKLKRQ